MKFIKIKLKGAYIIETERLEDEHGLNPHIVQCNISFTKRREHSVVCIIK